jgi:hypothetical protein
MKNGNLNNKNYTPKDGGDSGVLSQSQRAIQIMYAPNSDNLATTRKNSNDIKKDYNSSLKYISQVDSFQFEKRLYQNYSNDWRPEAKVVFLPSLNSRQMQNIIAFKFVAIGNVITKNVGIPTTGVSNFTCDLEFSMTFKGNSFLAGANDSFDPKQFENDMIGQTLFRGKLGKLTYTLSTNSFDLSPEPFEVDLLKTIPYRRGQEIIYTDYPDIPLYDVPSRTPDFSDTDLYSTRKKITADQLNQLLNKADLGLLVSVYPTISLDDPNAIFVYNNTNLFFSVNGSFLYYGNAAKVVNQ